MAPNAAIAALETEFRQLAQDARSKEGLAGFFSSAADQQAVKDAAERVILKVRAYADAPDALDQVKTHYQVGAGEWNGGCWRAAGCSDAVQRGSVQKLSVHPAANGGRGARALQAACCSTRLLLRCTSCLMCVPAPAARRARRRCSSRCS